MFILLFRSLDVAFEFYGFIKDCGKLIILYRSSILTGLFVDEMMCMMIFINDFQLNGAHTYITLNTFFFFKRSRRREF